METPLKSKMTAKSKYMQIRSITINTGDYRIREFVSRDNMCVNIVYTFIYPEV